jgi:dethiobiotin synthetase
MLNNQSYFVTGTDTNVGKTIVVSALVNLYLSQGINVVPFKPIQTGMDDDIGFVLQHSKAFLKDIKKEELVSYCFSKACSPHLAAFLEKREIKIDKIFNDYNYLTMHYKNIIVEGAGGIMVPLAKDLLMLDIIQKLDLPVILVIANKLGAINHSLLTIDKLTEIKMKPEILIFNDCNAQDNQILDDNQLIISDISNIKKVIRIPFMEQLDIGYISEKFRGIFFA